MGVVVVVCIVRIELEHLVKFCWACAWLMISLMAHMVSFSESATSNFCFLATLFGALGAGGDAAGEQPVPGGGAGGGLLGVFGAAFDAVEGQDMAGEGAADDLVLTGAAGMNALVLCCCSCMKISLSHWNFSAVKTKRAWASGA